MTDRCGSDSAEDFLFDGLHGLLDGETDRSGTAGGNTTGLMNRDFPQVDGGSLQIDLCIVDCGDETDTMFDAITSLKSKARVRGWFGRGVGAKGDAFTDRYKTDRSKGDRRGDNWIEKRGKRPHRYVIGEVNHWKSFVCRRLAIEIGKRSGISIFGRGKRNARLGSKFNQLLADHIGASEIVQFMTCKQSGRSVWEWDPGSARRPNHFFDCLVGCAVAAAIRGCKLPTKARKKKKGKKQQRRGRSVTVA